mgnify:FL=1|tara:strand:- start:334 stop:579 length:246 start_codon:yes stop_codon:yes gene_type:complete
MEVPSHVSFLTRTLINLLRNRKDVLALSVELLIDEKYATPNPCPDEIDDESELAEFLAAEQAADTISTLNRIYNTPHGGRS